MAGLAHPGTRDLTKSLVLMASRPDPKLSIVATTRNDDHGGNQLARTQLFVDGLAEQSLRFKLPIELLMVEWNPPVDKPPLAEALSWPRSDWFEPAIVV